MSLIARIASLANRDRLTTVGFTLTGVWLFLVALFWLLGPAGTDGGPSGVARLVSIMGTVLPLALIWLGVSLARQLAILRAEAEDLRARLAHLRGDAAPLIPRDRSTPPTPPDPPHSLPTTGRPPMTGNDNYIAELHFGAPKIDEEAFGAFIRDEIARWGRMARAAGIEPE